MNRSLAQVSETRLRTRSYGRWLVRCFLFLHLALFSEKRLMRFEELVEQHRVHLLWCCPIHAPLRQAHHVTPAVCLRSGNVRSEASADRSTSEMSEPGPWTDQQ